VELAEEPSSGWFGWEEVGWEEARLSVGGSC